VQQQVRVFLLGLTLKLTLFDFGTRLGISFTSEFRDPTLLSVVISSVPFAKLHTLGPELKDALSRLVREPFDLERMKDNIKQSRLQTLSVVESAPGSWIQGNVLQGE
jgi:hypothetical protein